MGARVELHGDDPGSPAPHPSRSSSVSSTRVRPGLVTDPVPQEGVERHVVEHRVEACPFVQILDAPVPHGGNLLVVEALRHLDLHIPEQVIDVLKISSSRRRCRRRRVPVVQTAEQLVEVPEFVQLAALFEQQMAEASGAPQGFHPGQDYSLVWEQIVDTPVPHGRGRAHQGGLQGARPGQNSTAFYGAEHVDIPVPQGRGVGGGLLGARPDTNSAASSVRSGAADEVFPGGFRTFSRGQKSATLGPHSGSELSADFTSWTPAACGVPMVPEPVLEVEAEEEYLVTRMDEYGRWWYRSEVHPGRWFLRDTDGVVGRAQLGLACFQFCVFLFMCQSTVALG